MTIITDRRTYHFDIISEEFNKNKQQDLVYVVRFYYPKCKKNRWFYMSDKNKNEEFLEEQEEGSLWSKIKKLIFSVNRFVLYIIFIFIILFLVVIIYSLLSPTKNTKQKVSEVINLSNANDQLPPIPTLNKIPVTQVKKIETKPKKEKKDNPPPLPVKSENESSVLSKNEILQAKQREQQKIKASIFALVGTPPPYKTKEQKLMDKNFQYRGDYARLLGKGKIIDVVLETALSSDTGGEVRAFVMRDIYAQNGKNILVPKGSRVFGSYSTNINGQYARIYIIWNRIDLESGYSVTINGTGVDALGRNGNRARYDNKFAQILQMQY